MKKFQNYSYGISVAVGLVLALTATRQAAAVPVELADDINSSASGLVEHLTVYNGELYFAANRDAKESTSFGESLYKYNATTDMTVLVADVSGSGSNDQIQAMAVFNGELHFGAREVGAGGVGQELYKTTGSGATLAVDINPSGDGGPRDPVVYQGDLYFGAVQPGSGRELFKYDGTTVSLTNDTFPGAAAGTTPRHMTVFDGSIYYMGSDGTSGDELWRFDPVNGNQIVADLFSGGGFSSPNFLVEFMDELYFGATDGSVGRELYKYNATTDTVVLVEDLLTGTPGSDPEHLTVLNDILYFSALADPSIGRELYMYDGTTVSLVADIFPGSTGSQISSIAAYDGTIYFGASEGNITTNNVDLYRLVLPQSPGGDVEVPEPASLWLLALAALAFVRRRPQ